MDAAPILPRNLIFLACANDIRSRTLPTGFVIGYCLSAEGCGPTPTWCASKPFDFENPIVFAWQDERFLNNAVLGPAGGRSRSAKWLAESCEFPESHAAVR